MNKDRFFQGQVNLIDLIIIVTCAVVAILTTVLYGSPSETVLGIFGGALGVARHGMNNRQTAPEQPVVNKAPELPASTIQTVAQAIKQERENINKIGKQVNQLQDAVIDDKCNQILHIAKEKKIDKTVESEEKPTKSLFDEK